MIDTDADMCIGDMQFENGDAKKDIVLNAKFEKDYYSNDECIDYLFFSNNNHLVSVWNKMISRRVLDKALLDLEKCRNKPKVSTCVRIIFSCSFLPITQINLCVSVVPNIITFNIAINQQFLTRKRN